MDAFEELERAVRHNDVKKVSQVMTNSPNLKDPGFSWIINDAINRGLTQVSRILLENGVSANSNSQNLCKPSPLMNACKQGHKNIVKLLLEYGADVNGEKNFGTPPILIAARTGNLAVLSLLIEWNANIDQRMDYDFVKWPHKAHNMSEAKLACLTAPYENNTVMIEACRAQHLEVVEALLSRGADMHATNRANETPLHIAASPKPWLSQQSSNKGILPTLPEIVRRLLEHGADVNAQNIFGQTPLDRTLSEIEHILHCRIFNKTVTETLQNHFRNFRYLVQAGGDLTIYANPDMDEEDLYGFLLDAYLEHQAHDTRDKSCLCELSMALKTLHISTGRPRDAFIKRFDAEVSESSPQKHNAINWLKSRQKNCRSLKELSGMKMRESLRPPLMLTAFAEELELPSHLQAYLITL